jgi:hypothetical protein
MIYLSRINITVYGLVRYLSRINTTVYGLMIYLSRINITVYGLVRYLSSINIIQMLYLKYMVFCFGWSKISPFTSLVHLYFIYQDTVRILNMKQSYT